MKLAGKPHGRHRRGTSRSRVAAVIAVIVSAAAALSASVAASAGPGGTTGANKHVPQSARHHSPQSAWSTNPGKGHQKHSPTPAPTITPTTTQPPTTPPPAADPTVCVASDVHSGGSSPASSTSQSSFATYLKSLHCDRIIMPGDETYNGYASQWSTFNGWYGAVKDKILPARGNHDAMSALSTYTDYWGSRVTTGGIGNPWYSTNIGAWHVISLDLTGSAATTAEMTWLNADLNANAGKPTIAFWHLPRYATGYYGDNTSSESVWSTLSAHGADVVLNGHVHVAQRFTVTRGIREFIDSSGGYSLHTGSNTSSLTRAWIVPGPVFGVYQLTLHPTSYDWTFTNTAGQVLDHGTSTAS